ncbi:50S ribosomal protein L25 [Patescibacteria group bacterium]|nr:50S ribosomal protein L25 [Patescibacteria group bacterium]
MATKITLKADKRKILGRKVKSLRSQGILPVNLFGKGVKSQSLQVKTKDFTDTFKKAGETNLVYVETGADKELPVLISNIQVHPVTSKYLHADLYQVDLTKKVTVNVPVNLIGESPAVKDGAVLVQTLKELEVEALPTSIPESIDFDLSGLLEIGDSLKISDTKDIKGADVIQDKETVIVQIQAQKEEEIIEAPVEEEPAEGEEAKPAEGDAKPEESAEAKETKPEDQKEPSETKPEPKK